MWYIYIVFTIYIYIYNLLSGIIYVCMCKDHIYVLCDNFCTYIRTKTIVVIEIQQTISGKNTCHNLTDTHNQKLYNKAEGSSFWKLKGNCFGISSSFIDNWQTSTARRETVNRHPKGIQTNLKASRRCARYIFQLLPARASTLFKSRTARNWHKDGNKTTGGAKKYTCSPRHEEVICHVRD